MLAINSIGEFGIDIRSLT